MSADRTGWTLTDSVGTDGGSPLTHWNVWDTNNVCTDTPTSTAYVSITDSCYTN